MLGLVKEIGFGCLILACFALAAGPAAAQENEHAPPPQAEGAPPPFASEESTEQEAPPPPASDTPRASEPRPAPEQQESTAPSDGRVRIRSVTRPEPTLAPEAEPVKEETPAAEAPAPRERSDRRERPASPDRIIRSEMRAAAVAVPQPIAAPSDADTQPTERKRAEPSGRSESLPERVVPRPVREIAEVVPTPAWLALAALALLAAAFAASSWIAAGRARRQRNSLLQEIGLLQAALLPSVPPNLPVSVGYRPAEDASAGGDVYDAFALPSGAIGLMVGNVSGHGRDALARTTFVRYSLRAHLDAGLEPREVLKVVSEALGAHLDGGFATLTIAVYDPTNSRFTYASAGHPPPVVVGAEEEFEPVVACSAPPLGFGEPTGFRQSTFTLTAGARACLYTGGEDIELLLAALPDHADADSLLDAVANAADGIEDDMAVCLVTAPVDAPVTGPRIEELEVDDEYEVGDSLERFLRACGLALADVPGVLREAGEAARHAGSVTVRVRMNDFRPGADVLPGNLVRLAERRRAVR